MKYRGELEKAIARAVHQAVAAVGIDRIRKEEFFGMNQPKDADA